MRIYNYAFILRNNEDFDNVIEIEGEIEHEGMNADDAICDATQRLFGEEEEDKKENIGGGCVVVKDSGKIWKLACSSGCILERNEMDEVTVNRVKFVMLDDEYHQIFEDFTTNTKYVNCDCYEADAVEKEDRDGNQYRCWYVDGYGWCCVPVNDEEQMKEKEND